MNPLTSLRSITALFEKDLRKFVRHLPSIPAGLYDPIRYALGNGGKRIRPSLALIGSGLYSKNAKNALCVGRAIELFHNFTLIHDDIMDGSPTRRGKPTVFKKFGNHAAILSGDVLFTMAFQQLNLVSAGKQKEILSVFARTATEVCEGQEWDMSFEKTKMVGHNDYMSMIRQKTAVLLGAALQMGAMAGGAKKKDADLLFRIGCEMGIVFQIKDDLLDCFGNSGKTGKKIGQDIVAGKKTWLSIHAYHLLKNRKEAGSFLKKLHSGLQPRQKIAEILVIYRKLELEKRGLRVCARKTGQIEKMINRLKLPQNRKKSLILLQKNLLTRAG